MLPHLSLLPKMEIGSVAVWLYLAWMRSDFVWIIQPLVLRNEFGPIVKSVCGSFFSKSFKKKKILKLNQTF